MFSVFSLITFPLFTHFNNIFPKYCIRLDQKHDGDYYTDADGHFENLYLLHRKSVFISSNNFSLLRRIVVLTW